MPGLSGLETRKALARDERTRLIPVVMMTTADHVQQLGSGIDSLGKPFDATRLLAKVDEYRRRLPAAAG